MEKIGIITDSACDLRAGEYNPDLVKVIPLKIAFSDGEFKDGVTISAEETYHRMDVETPKTSLPDGSDMENALQYFKDNGFTHVIAIFLASSLSGTYNAFQHFAEEFKDSLIIESVDSNSLSLAEGLLVQLAQKLIGEGKSFDFVTEQVIAKMKTINVYFVLDTLEYLIKGGRIGKVSGTIGQLLNIKPVIHIGEDGVYHTADKARGKRQSIVKMLAILKTKYLDRTPCNVHVAHGGSPIEGAELLETVKAMPGVKYAQLAQITPSLGVHTGKGLLGWVLLLR